MTSELHLKALTDACAVPPERRPRHVAIIMDGNGRWAERQGLDRTAGHRAGTKAARAIIECCARLEIEALTLYSFSTENWKRPAEEVAALMALVIEMLPLEHETLQKHGIRFRMIGDRQGVPSEVLDAMDRATELTQDHDGLQLNIALNYGSRQELVHAARSLAHQVRDGHLDPDDIDEDRLAGALWTAGLPDPDVLIRTAGEVRVSNYLLWQISYAELIVVDECWPDFTAERFIETIGEFADRTRRFGAVPSDRVTS